jgi:hypothetical protein
MQRTSETIGTLAAALAKAQLQLTNPEKSLVATIRKDGGAEQTFRYAPLSSGLEIVRKTLGDQEIATVQTTSIDQAAGIVQLTTVLAHSSGEWIASDWPVCSISETATPQRMGEALTYARRYGLFTLVGIAGEDDRDAPNATATKPISSSEKPTVAGYGCANAGSPNPRSRTGFRNRAKNTTTEPKLGPEESAEIRDRLVAEINDLTSGDSAAMWAHRQLRQKNRLTAAAAERIEEVFEGKLANLATRTDEPEPDGEGLKPSTSLNQTSKKKNNPVKAIDKSVLALPEPRRIRDRHHVKFVARHPCLVCGRRPADAHHLRFAQSRATGRKVSDEFTVPLCRGHHREVHRCGDEAGWWTNVGVNPTAAARALWLEMHPLLHV